MCSLRVVSFQQLRTGDQLRSYLPAIDLDPDRGSPLFSKRNVRIPRTHWIFSFVVLEIEAREIEETDCVECVRIGAVRIAAHRLPTIRVRVIRMDWKDSAQLKDSLEAVQRRGVPKATL